MGQNEVQHLSIIPDVALLSAASVEGADPTIMVRRVTGVKTSPLVQSRTGALAADGRGYRLKQSALVLAVPAQCSTVKSYSCSRRLHLASFHVSFYVVIILLRGSWSVTRVKEFPNKYDLKWLVAHTTARHSPSKEE